MKFCCPFVFSVHSVMNMKGFCLLGIKKSQSQSVNEIFSLLISSCKLRSAPLSDRSDAFLCSSAKLSTEKVKAWVGEKKKEKKDGSWLCERNLAGEWPRYLRDGLFKQTAIHTTPCGTVPQSPLVSSTGRVHRTNTKETHGREWRAG